MGKSLHLTFIEDISIEKLDVYARLREPELKHFYEPDPGLFIAESPLVIGRALDSGYEPESFLISAEEFSFPGNSTGVDNGEVPESDCGQQSFDKFSADNIVKESTRSIIEMAPDTTIYAAPENELVKITGFKLTRGMMCAMRRKKLLSLHDFLSGLDSMYNNEKEYSRRLRIVVLEDVVNPTNVGAIFRSAAALHIDGILLTSDCADPLQRRALRVAMGNTFLIPWTYILPEDDWMNDLQSHGFRIAAMALSDNSIRIDDTQLKNTDRLAIVMGSEGPGLKEKTIENSDYVVRIPMSSGVDSLNVAAASAVAFWELTK